MLKPGDAWDDFKDLAYNRFAVFDVAGIAVANGLEADFAHCSKPAHPIEATTLAQLGLYFKSSLSSVRVHEGCKVEGSVVAVRGRRVAITFGEHIYFAQDVYKPQDSDGFAVLAHELTHVLQYRRKGFGDFVMEYARSCRLGADTSCAIEQDAYKHQALVLEDRKRDSDGGFTCPLEKERWGPDNVALHSCTTNRQFLDCNAINGAPKPRFCKQLDNCPNRFNPGQEDFDNDATGNACDWGWTSDPATAVTFQKFGDFNGDHRADIVVTRGGNTPGSSSALLNHPGFVGELLV